MTYTPTPQIEEGGQKKMIVSDWETQNIMSDILKELKKMNIQLNIVTDNEVKNQEIT